MHYRSIALVTSAVASLSLFAMKEEIKKEYGNENNEHSIQIIEQNRPQKKCWPYKLCPEPYKDKYCNECRGWISVINGGVSLLCAGIQGGCFGCSMCANSYDSCGKACRYTWGPTGSEACDSTSDTCFSIIAWGITSIIGAGIVTSACAWNPCCSEEGCIMCVRDEEHNVLKTDDIEIEMRKK